MATAALREQIESERRTIRILESELALLVRRHHRQSRKRSHEEAQWEQQSKHVKADSSVEGEVSQHRQSPQMEARAAPQHSDVMKDTHRSTDKVGLDDKDLLFILDALQSTPPTADTPSIEARWQDDPMAFRLMPRLGGIAFTSVSGPVRKNFDDDAFIDSEADDDDTIRRKRRLVSYELCGIVTAKADDDSDGGNSASAADGEVLGGGRIKFRVVPTVEFETTQHSTSNGRSEEERERAKVVGIESTFGLEGPSSSSAEEDNPILFPNKELRNLSNLTSKSCDLPQLFRNLVTFTEFHTKRVAFYQKWKTMFGKNMLELDNAEAFRINLLDKGDEPALSLILSWRWKFTPLGRGEEELRLVDCSRRPRRGGDDDDDEGTTEYGTWMNEIMDPSGLQDLVSCSSGCGAAVELLLKACGPPMEDVTK